MSKKSILILLLALLKLPHVEGQTVPITYRDIVDRPDQRNEPTSGQAFPSFISPTMSPAGGVWASASVQGAVLPGDSTRKPSPAPTFTPTARSTFAPSRQSTTAPNFPTLPQTVPQEIIREIGSLTTVLTSAPPLTMGRRLGSSRRSRSLVDDVDASAAKSKTQSIVVERVAEGEHIPSPAQRRLQTTGLPTIAGMPSYLSFQNVFTFTGLGNSAIRMAQNPGLRWYLTVDLYDTGFGGPAEAASMSDMVKKQQVGFFLSIPTSQWSYVRVSKCAPERRRAANECGNIPFIRCTTDFDVTSYIQDAQGGSLQVVMASEGFITTNCAMRDGNRVQAKYTITSINPQPTLAPVRSFVRDPSYDTGATENHEDDEVGYTEDNTFEELVGYGEGHDDTVNNNDDGYAENEQSNHGDDQEYTSESMHPTSSPVGHGMGHSGDNADSSSTTLQTDAAILCDFYNPISSASKALLPYWCAKRSSGRYQSPCGDGIRFGLSNWFGVTCGMVGSAERVVELNLVVPLDGSKIPSTLGGLITLQKLSLALTKLSGTIPSQLGSLTNLRELNLAGNSLSGTVPSSLCKIGSKAIINIISNPLITCYPSCLSSYQYFMKSCPQCTVDTAPNSAGSNKSEISEGTVIAIGAAVGGLLFVAMLAGAGYWFWLQQQKKEPGVFPENGNGQFDGTGGIEMRESFDTIYTQYNEFGQQQQQQQQAMQAQMTMANYRSSVGVSSGYGHGGGIDGMANGDSQVYGSHGAHSTPSLPPAHYSLSHPQHQSQPQAHSENDHRQEHRHAHYDHVPDRMSNRLSPDSPYGHIRPNSDALPLPAHSPPTRLHAHMSVSNSPSIYAPPGTRSNSATQRQPVTNGDHHGQHPASIRGHHGNESDLPHAHTQPSRVLSLQRPAGGRGHTSAPRSDHY